MYHFQFVDRALWEFLAKYLSMLPLWFSESSPYLSRITKFLLFPTRSLKCPTINIFRPTAHQRIYLGRKKCSKCYKSNYQQRGCSINLSYQNYVFLNETPYISLHWWYGFITNGREVISPNGFIQHRKSQIKLIWN